MPLVTYEGGKIDLFPQLSGVSSEPLSKLASGAVNCSSAPMLWVKLFTLVYLVRSKAGSFLKYVAVVLFWIHGYKSWWFQWDLWLCVDWMKHFSLFPPCFKRPPLACHLLLSYHVSNWGSKINLRINPATFCVIYSLQGIRALFPWGLKYIPNAHMWICLCVHAFPFKKKPAQRCRDIFSSCFSSYFLN